MQNGESASQSILFSFSCLTICYSRDYTTSEKYFKPQSFPIRHTDSGFLVFRCIKTWFHSDHLYIALILGRRVGDTVQMTRRTLRLWRKSISTYLGFLMNIEEEIQESLGWILSAFLLFLIFGERGNSAKLIRPNRFSLS
jgi:hypothetical protein